MLWIFYVVGNILAGMAKVQITLLGWKCERCGHEWVPRKGDAHPKVCPHCKSPYWDKPKVSKQSKTK